MYHCALALFFRTGIKCENHTAAIIILREVYSLDNSIILEAKKERINKQYYVDFSVAKEEVIQAISTAENFIVRITDFTEKLTEAKIKEYRTRLSKILKE